MSTTANTAEGSETTTAEGGELMARARQEANESILKALQPYLPSTNKVNSNELVMTPEVFNGYLPKPRDWIDSYEEAFLANDWSEATALKYFLTFLRGAALDWFKAMVRPKMIGIESWQQLRDIFTKHYLSKDELRVRRQEFSALTQEYREPSTIFVPRAYKLLKQVYPKLDDDEALDRITSMLRPDIIRSLPLVTPDSIEELVAMACKMESRQRQLDQRMRTKTDVRYPSRQPYQDTRKPNYEVRRQPEAVSEQPRPTKQPDTSSESGPLTNRSSIQCYRCKGIGHIGKDCVATKAIDGKPIRLPKNLQTNGIRVNVVQEPRLALNANVQFKDTVNNVLRSFLPDG